MSGPQPQPEQSTDQVVEACAISVGRQVLGRELSPAEMQALRAIFSAAAQALAEGFIERLATQVLAERRDEKIEEFFENVKTD